jgi:hypothetical protein
LQGFWRTFFKPDSNFWMVFTFQCSNVRGDQGPSKQNKKNVEKVWTLIHEDCRQTIIELTPFGSVMEFCQEILTEHLNMCHIATSSRQHVHSHIPENHRDVTNNNMAVVPHPLYSPDLTPCDFALFPKLKIKLKGQHFVRVSDV